MIGEMLLRIKSIYFIVSPYFIIMVVWAIATGRIHDLIICFMALIIHETGHTAAVLFTKERISIFYLLPFGFSFRLRNQAKISKKNMAIILTAGPAISLAASGLLFFWTKDFAMVNFFIGMMNLIPLGKLDGGGLFELYKNWQRHDKY